MNRLTFLHASVVIVLALGVAPPPASGQAQARDAAPDSSVALLRRAQRANWLLRLTLPDRQVAGRIRAIGDSTVFFPRGDAPLDSVRRIERGRRVGDGGWVGALLGGAAVGALGVVASGLCEGDCSGAAVYGAVVGGAMGATLGFILAEITVPGHIEWREVWP